MKTVLPGAAIGLFGGGENSRMFAMVARRMGYRVHVYSPTGDPADSLADVSIQAPYEDLDRVREFAAGVDVVTVAAGDVPILTLQAARAPVMRPSVKVFEAIENDDGIGGKRDVAAGAEFSVIGARGVDGECVFYPPIAVDRVAPDDHCGHVDIARAPAAIGVRLTKRAIALTQDILEDLDLTGIVCVEFILTPEREILIREVSPHPHSSGHLTIDACVTSQFEQQLRAVCGLPLGSVSMLRPAAMATLTDATGERGEPDWASACAFPEVKLHLYGGRRGHLTATAVSATRAKQIVRAARASLNAASLNPVAFSGE